MILSVRDVKAGYGPVTVLRDVSFAQNRGEILGIVGHNGMGKTTLLRVLMGLLPCSAGGIAFEAESVEAAPAHRRSGLGIGYVPQGVQAFPNLTVLESLKLATARPGQRPMKTIEEITALFPRLKPLFDRQSGALSGGERQLLAIARAVIRTPSLLLLDEMTEGVQPSIVEEIADRLQAVHRGEGTSILMVDQELAFVAALATRVLVMQKGRLVREVTPGELTREDVLGGFGTA